MHKIIARIFCLAAAGLLPFQTVAQTPEDDRRIAEQLSINNSRPVLLRTLAPKIMPNCITRASDEEVADFFAYWRELAKQMQLFHKKHGIPEQRPLNPLDKALGITPIPKAPLAEVANLSADAPGMADQAREEIELWHIYSCVVREFGASRFFAHYGFFGGAWPEPFPAKFAYEPDDKRAVVAPDMSSLEPLDALGRFFRKAQAQGLWAMTDPNHEDYFFDRYESLYFVNMRRSDATDRWFGTPPWKQPIAHAIPQGSTNQ